MDDNFIYKQQLSPVLVIVIYLTRSSSMENYLLFLLIKTFTLSLVSIQSSNRKITFFYTQQHLPDENGETCMALEAHIRQSSAILKEHSVLPCQEDEIKRLFARIDMLLRCCSSNARGVGCRQRHHGAKTFARISWVVSWLAGSI